MQFPAKKTLYAAILACAFLTQPVAADELSDTVSQDYQQHLGALFDYFHRNPELSGKEVKTAARMATELRDAGYEVTEGIFETGVVAIMKNGPGPLVMMRADMDGLPVSEKSGLANASVATQIDPNGDEVPVMHACGHDVHITSLVGTARVMANSKDTWSGTLMLIAQPAEEAIGGAKGMMDAGIWEQFGQPDYALAFHVASGVPTGKIVATLGAPMSGADMVDIIVHGIGAHGASAHRGIDPVVLGSQIVLALQTIVSRELAPREPGVITVGAFHSGTKHNIISDEARLQLTVRNDNLATRKLLLDAIERVAINMGRVAGLPEDLLPEVIVHGVGVPPTVNNIELTQKLRNVWAEEFGDDIFYEAKRDSMGAEDFPFFTTEPYIPSTYFSVGGTPQADFDTEANGGPAVPSHHSPLFKITPEASVTLGVEATVVALRDLLQAE